MKRATLVLRFPADRFQDVYKKVASYKANNLRSLEITAEDPADKARLAAIANIHYPFTAKTQTETCVTCDRVWPCRTIRYLRATPATDSEAWRDIEAAREGIEA